VAPQRSAGSDIIDRVAFVANVVGTIVPLLTLAYVADRYVLPALADAAAAHRFVALIVSVSVLSLGSFVVLRRVTRQSLRRLDAHGRRLEGLLEASRSVAQAPYGAEVARNAAEFAVALSHADAAWVLVAPEKQGEPFGLEGRAGAEEAELYSAYQKALQPVLELAASGVRIALPGEEASDPGAGRPPAAVAAAPIASGERVDGVLLALRKERKRGFDEAQVHALSTLAALASVARHNADLHDSQRNFFAHVTEILMTALDAHMNLQGGHSRRVAHFSCLVGREFGFEEARLERLHFAALLHDIGMLKIANMQNRGPGAYRQHPALGFRMLKPIRLWQDLAPLVLHHHEWWNGGGYPEGLAGEAIPLESRIIGVSEAFDTMTSCKSYRDPLSLEAALEEVRTGAGSQFDPTVARIFVDLAQRGLIEISSED
jgi:HD-GYP domain-containing protein (c-di-GMP phosphodiesterase class II)